MMGNADVFRLFRETEFSNPAFRHKWRYRKDAKISMAVLQFEADSAALRFVLPVLPGANGCLCRCRTVFVFVVIY